MPYLSVKVNHETKKCDVKYEGTLIDLIPMVSILIDDMAEEAKVSPLQLIHELTNLCDEEEE